MPGRINQDEKDFLDIVRGKWRKDLLRYLQKGQITIMGPGRGVAIPVESIEIPHLHFSPIPNDAEVQDSEYDGEESDIGPDLGVGQGPGKPGADLGPAQPGGSDGNDKGEGDGEESGERSAGMGRGPEIIEIEVPPEEFYELFKEVLELPNIKPKGEKQIKTEAHKYTDIRTTGPDSLLHKKRTYKQALKRTIAEGTYNPKSPKIIPYREDKRYRIPDLVKKPQNNAVIINMMDVSGSMSRDDRAVVRYFCALCEFWLMCNYDGMETVWIIHDGEADRVSKEVFFSTQRGGGTVISSAHKKMLEVIHDEYPPSQWNIYPFYHSDGFNIGGVGDFDDDQVCRDLIRNKILPTVNQYTHCEVNANRYWYQDYERQRSSANGSFSPAGSFGKMLQREFRSNKLVVCTNLTSMDKVPDAIRAVFAQGH